MQKIPLYLMPGMAASPKIFELLSFPEMYELHYMHWILPEENESLPSYVARLISLQIKHRNPILLGVSFGGIIVQEIAKQIPVRQLILISTVKNRNEFSPFFDTALRYKLYKLFPSRIMKQVNLLEKIAFTKNLRKKMRLYKMYMTMHQPRYLDWAIERILYWKQEKNPVNFVHIVGENDRVFPPKYIKAPKIIVPKGRHDMILFKAGWFNKNLPNLLVIPKTNIY